MNESQFNIIIEKLNHISSQIDQLHHTCQQQELKNQELNNKLNDHIDFINSTYSWLLPSLHFIKNKVDQFNSKNYLSITHKLPKFSYSNYTFRFFINLCLLFLFYFVYINGNKINII